MSEVFNQEEADNKMIDEAFQKLLDTYTSSRHRQKVDIINKAFNFARQAHKGVRRLSGEPYIMHPIAVAQIACEEIGLGSTSISAALLHDVVEDTDYTVEDIENIFGQKIAQIVDGLTKISGGIFGEQASAQAENFKKLLLTMSDDIRVILIKIADRLHNMRTLESQPANKQYKIAGETLYIYAPLANRLGLNRIKSELENLSFRFEHPEEFRKIQAKIANTQEKRDILFNEFTKPIKEELDKMGMKYELKMRVKTPYSIWNKMQNKHVSFEDIYDILAVRIIFTPSSLENEIQECFNIYVALNKIYVSHPDRLRDWVNHPKANGYQALHCTYMSKKGQWIEVQIRSERMNEQAEQGFAAHWKYKDKDSDGDNNISEDEGELNEWLRTIKEILDDPQPDAMDFLDAIKLNLFASEIFVFTPKGEIKTMPTGCTALDFAFSIHTFLGTHCIGAKVNHKLVPMSHKLSSGDQVEILTSKSQHVKPEWINFVSSAKAKAKIQAILRKDCRESLTSGENILREFLKKHDIEYSGDVVDTLCQNYEKTKAEDLFVAIGEKKIILGDKDLDRIKGKNSQKSGKGWKKYVPFIGRNKKSNAADIKPEPITVGKDFNKKAPVYISEETFNNYQYPSCCHPIPGDDILGYIDNKNHIEIHKRSCPVANKLKASYGNRILDAKWKMHKELFFDSTIEIKGIDRIGLLKEVTLVISDQMNVNIHRVTITCDEGIFDGKIELRVHDRDDVNKIVKNLKKINDLKEINQIM